MVQSMALIDTNLWNVTAATNGSGCIAEHDAWYNAAGSFYDEYLRKRERIGGILDRYSDRHCSFISFVYS